MRLPRWLLLKDPISWLIGLGVPALILLAVVETAGVAGGAAMLVGLATLGGPFGLIGGFGLLAVLIMVSKKLTEMGFDYLFSQILKNIRVSGRSKEDVFREIEGYPIPEPLKRSLKGWVEQFWNA